MKKVIGFTPNTNNIKASHRRVKLFCDEWVLIEVDCDCTTGILTTTALIVLRVYRSKAFCTACAWIELRNFKEYNGEVAGNGKGNSAYEAAQNALFDAGLHYDDEYVFNPEDRLKAYAEFMGITAYLIHHANA